MTNQLYLAWKKNAVLNCSIYYSATRNDIKLSMQVYGFNFDQCSYIYKSKSVNLTDGKQLCASSGGANDNCNGFHSGNWNLKQILLNSSNIAFRSIIQTGSPLMAKQPSDVATNENEFSYLVGIISFGPKHWFVLFCFVYANNIF